jgi:signal recognition particle subunit SRP14
MTMAPQQQVSNEQFLEQLTRLFESSSKAHSVFVSHKKITKDVSLTEPTIVIRATDGRGGSSASSNRTKFTTHVQASKLSAFQDQYSAILRASTAAFLRKRDKAKERRVDKLLKEKRKRMEEVLHSISTTATTSNTKSTNGEVKATNASGTGGVKGSTPNVLKVTSIGAKRGAGRRKRQQAQRKAKQLRREQKRIAGTATTQTSTQKVG